MTDLGDDEFAVLNAVYLRKIATREVIAGISGLSVGEVDKLVTDAVARLQLEDVGGMYMLSESGTAEILAAYRNRYSALPTDPDVLAWYGRFEGLNKQFLLAISAWQTDPDQGRLERLLRVVERLITSLAAMDRVVPRYSRYADRFRAAMERVDAGSSEFVSGPTVDSLHNIWFEFHEDILTVIGRPRDVAEAQA